MKNTFRTWRILRLLLGALLGVLTMALIVSLFFLKSRQILDAMVKERLQSVASVAAMQFTGEELERIRGVEAMETKAFVSIVDRLRLVRQSVPNTRFTYIMRRSADPMILQFVADADSLATNEELDDNGNGTIESAEEPSLPGDPYSVEEITALQGEAFLRPTTDDAITHDQWGATLSGYAPIRMANGTVAGVIGIDMAADDYLALVSSLFSVHAFLLFLLGGSLIVLAAVLAFWKRKMDGLKRLEEERGWLLQLILHQVGTPLTIFKWSLESLRDSCTERANKGEAEEHFHVMEEGISRLEHVKDVLLAAEKIQSNTVRYVPARTSLKAIFRELQRGLVGSLKQRKQILDVSMKGDLILRLDRKLMAGVLRELVDNAMIYSPDGGTITVTARRLGRQAEIVIIDRGSGIPRRDLQRIFSQFARGSNSGKYDPNGTGVGLYIARGIIERAGGTITVKSAEGKGTTVRILLPLK